LRKLRLWSSIPGVRLPVVIGGVIGAGFAGGIEAADNAAGVGFESGESRVWV
jgi:hypothetical protein